MRYSRLGAHLAWERSAQDPQDARLVCSTATKSTADTREALLAASSLFPFSSVSFFLIQCKIWSSSVHLSETQVWQYVEN